MAEQREKLLHKRRGENRRSATAEKKCLHRAWFLQFAQFDGESIEESLEKVIAVCKEREIAIAATMAAERDMNICRNGRGYLMVRPSPGFEKIQVGVHRTATNKKREATKERSPRVEYSNGFGSTKRLPLADPRIAYV
jgi:hypothetical protein